MGALYRRRRCYLGARSRELVPDSATARGTKGPVGHPVANRSGGTDADCDI